ncbi:MAG: 2-hydroxychromene-2-carboxylate isomerase [Spirochaetota bacterium]|nr:2-hydroxychromene-2-carboxylate isomerase [Spirochaetota bacterium]
MSDTTIEFFWDVSSPYTYLASTQIVNIASECSTSVKWRPFSLGGVFKDTGNRPPLEVKSKNSYMLDDLKAWAAYYKVPLQFPSSFPVNSILPMRAAIAAERLGKGGEFAIAIMNAYWAEGKDPSLAEIIQSISSSAGLCGDEIIKLTQEPEIKEALKQNSTEAVNRGAFGAPTFFVGDKMFWGNDRLVLMRAYLNEEL